MKCQPAPLSSTCSAHQEQRTNRVSEQSQSGTGTRVLSLKTFRRSQGVKPLGWGDWEIFGRAARDSYNLWNSLTLPRLSKSKPFKWIIQKTVTSRCFIIVGRLLFPAQIRWQRLCIFISLLEKNKNKVQLSSSCTCFSFEQLVLK